MSDEIVTYTSEIEWCSTVVECDIMDWHSVVPSVDWAGSEPMGCASGA